MKTKTIAIMVGNLFIGAALIFAGCDRGETDQSTQANDNDCVYTYAPSTTEMKWTAFKFTKKVGVGGTFDSIKLTSSKKADRVEKFVEGLQFQIDTSSVNSNNEQRDERIRKYFFQKMSGGGKTITGKIKKLKPEKKAGIMSIDMNGVRKEVDFNYKVMRGNEVEIWTTIDTGQWNAQNSIQALNDACYDLHTGEDGVSKLWPDVELRAYTKLDQDCK